MGEPNFEIKRAWGDTSNEQRILISTQTLPTTAKQLCELFEGRKVLCLLEGVKWEEDWYHMGAGKALSIVVGGKGFGLVFFD